MTTDVRFREHTDAVIAALEAAGLAVGDAVAPDVDPPYVTVYPIPGGARTGSLEDPHEDADLIYQVTCTGISRRQVEWLVDAVEVLLSGVVVDGRSIYPTVEMNPGVQRSDESTPPLFWATPRYRLMSTPRGGES